MNKLALSALLFTAPLLADMVVYEPSRDANSFTHWQSAAPDAVYQGFGAPGAFTTSSSYAVVGNSVCESCAFFGRQVLTDQITDTNSTRFAFTDPIMAFGLYFDAAGPGGPGSGIQVMADHVPTGANGMLYGSESGTFFGFSSSSPVREVEFVSPRDVNGNPYAGASETYQTPGIWYSSAHLQGATAVPEPSIWWDLIVLLAVLCMFGWRKRIRAGLPQPY